MSHFTISRITLICLLIPLSIARSQAGNADRYPLTFSRAVFDAPPTAEDLVVPRDEDAAFLDGVLQKVFPNGMQGLSEEQRSVETLRYTTCALLLKNNGGSATKILRDGYAICGGMSHVFRILCRRAGVPSRYIGAFYLRPIMGSHAISEVYYDGRWHLFDPTFGIFFYTADRYDGKGTVASFHDLIADPGGYVPMKAVAKPWGGKYDEADRAFGVQPVEPDYLKSVYGTPILDLYRKYLRETFPVAYGSDDLISFPVDADLRTEKEQWFGGVDGSATDVVLQALNGTAYIGSHYLGGSFPPALHTWTVRAPENAVLTVTYHSADENPPRLGFVALKAAHLLAVSREGKETAFTLRLIGPEGLFAVTCPSGAYTVDAMHVRVNP